MGEWHEWEQGASRDGGDPRDQYVIGPNGRMVSKWLLDHQGWESFQAQIDAATQRQLNPEIVRQEREQAIRQNPLLEHAAENKKVPRSRGGLGKCYLCNHPRRADFEADFKRLKGWEHGNGVKAYRAAVAAGGRLSRIAYLNHMNKHVTPPAQSSGTAATTPAQGQP